MVTCFHLDLFVFQFHLYQVVGRALSTENDEHLPTRLGPNPSSGELFIYFFLYNNLKQIILCYDELVSELFHCSDRNKNV